MTLENLFSLVEFIQATERSRRRPRLSVSVGDGAHDIPLKVRGNSEE